MRSFFHTKDFHDLSSSVSLQNIRIFPLKTLSGGIFNESYKLLKLTHVSHIDMLAENLYEVFFIAMNNNSFDKAN